MDGVNNDNHVDLLTIDELRPELALPAWITNSMASPTHDVDMPADYSPPSPIFSPANSPRHSPITISDADSEHGFTSAQNSQGPIITRASDIFNLPNDDSDLENDREVEIISLVGDYINRHKLPIQINGGYLFPQPTNIHNLIWEEYPFEPCSNHHVIPVATDKSFAKFYLTDSLCLTQRSTLRKLGPWVYLNNKISTLPKLHNFPQIPSFIVQLHQKLRNDQRVKDYLVTCQSVEQHGFFTLVIRVDVYMSNNPLECKFWTQTYNVDDHMTFGDKTPYYLQRDFVDMVYNIHVDA